MGAEFGVVLESEVVLQDGGYQAGKARVSGKGGVVEMVGQDFADEVGVHVHGAWTVWWGVDARADGTIGQAYQFVVGYGNLAWLAIIVPNRKMRSSSSYTVLVS